jgi:hypothetical protein
VARLKLVCEQALILFYVNDTLIAAKRMNIMESFKKLLLNSYEGTVQ